MQGHGARFLLCVCLLVNGCALRGCGEKAAPTPKSAEPTITLRFRPHDALGYREHWVYDLQVPGSGPIRSALSFDVRLQAKLDQDSFAVREIVRSYQLLENRRRVVGIDLAGVQLVYHWGRDHALTADIAADADTPELAFAAKAVAEAGRFGTLIEYPDQPIAVGDSWSIEPRQLVVAPGLEATLRPSYMLESIVEQGADRRAVITSDIQVDLVPLPIGEGVTIEGGGTASGNLRVRVRDGSLLEANTVMHFSQEVTVQNNEILGYREFSANAHVFTTAAGNDPDLAAFPYKLDKAESDHDCDLSLSSLGQRLTGAPPHQLVHMFGAEQAVSLPSVAAGTPLRERGVLLAITADERSTLYGIAITEKDLPTALRQALGTGHNTLYVFADAGLPVPRLHALLSRLPVGTTLQLVTHDERARTMQPKASRWLEERLHLALAGEANERDLHLDTLLSAHLALCEPALAKVRAAIADPSASQWDALPSGVIADLVKCGCTATNLDGLETVLYAIYGSPDLRSLAFKPVDLAQNDTPTVLELAKKLGARSH